jgi:hypothetical protein
MIKDCFVRGSIGYPVDARGKRSTLCFQRRMLGPVNRLCLAAPSPPYCSIWTKHYRYFLNCHNDLLVCIVKVRTRGLCRIVHALCLVPLCDIRRDLLGYCLTVSVTATQRRICWSNIDVCCTHPISLQNLSHRVSRTEPSMLYGSNCIVRGPCVEVRMVTNEMCLV